MQLDQVNMALLTVIVLQLTTSAKGLTLKKHVLETRPARGDINTLKVLAS